jgi:large subunit ribosomal protein L25
VENFEIEVTSRTELGNGASGRARKAGFIPSVVYHSGETSVPVLVSTREFTRLASAAKKSQVFVLKSNDQKLDGRPAIVKDVQIDYLKKLPIHVDFLALNENEDVEISVQIKFIGEAPGVKLDGGILTTLKREIAVRCLPKNIPQNLIVDISSLKIGQSMHVGQIAFPEGVVSVDAEDDTVVSVVAQSSAEPVTAAAAAAAEADPKAVAAKAAAKPAAAAKPDAKK